MGRPRKDHACTRCHRTPEQLTDAGLKYYASNRKCEPCLKLINHENYLQRKHASAALKAAKAKLEDATAPRQQGSNPDQPYEGQLSEDKSYIYTDGHWEIYDPTHAEIVYPERN
jgi:hypothetical protein